MLGDPESLVPAPPTAVDAAAGLDGVGDDEAARVDAETAATKAMGVASEGGRGSRPAAG